MKRRDMIDTLLGHLEAWEDERLNGEADIPSALGPVSADAGIMFVDGQDQSEGLALVRTTYGWEEFTFEDASLTKLLGEQIESASASQLRDYVAFIEYYIGL